MIQFNTVIENGVRYGERYDQLRYQLLLKADGATGLTLPAFTASVSSIDQQLTADVNALSPGLTIPGHTRERAALFSLEYSHMFGSGNTALNIGLTDMLSAINAGDRAEAWYSLRYELNPDQTTTAAREHFDEAQVFGLFQNVNPQSLNNVCATESLLAARMATLHEHDIATYETAFTAQLGQAQSDIAALSAAVHANFGTVTGIGSVLAPAVGRLACDFSDLDQLAPDIAGRVPNTSALASLTIDNAWVAPDVAGDQGAAHVVDRSGAPAANDLIFGSITLNGIDSTAADTLSGGDGNDFFIGGRGADAMDGGAGEDTISYLSATTAVTVDLGHGTGIGGLAAGDTYAGIEDVLGGSAADKLTGDASANLLYGGAGKDRLIGAAGSDSLFGGAGNDRIYGDATREQTHHLNSVADADLTHGNMLVGGLGGAAGFGESALARNDDGSTGAIDITSVFGASGLNFFGANYTSLFVNNNGNITFNSALSAFTPGTISAGFGNPIIAPFWADVDTRTGSGNSDLVYYDLDATHGVFTVTWFQVGFYSGHVSPNDSFQLQLINEGGGDFDIVLRYENIGWTTGDVSGGVAAHAGYSAGNGHDSFELSQSGNDAAMRGLPGALGNTGVDGLFVFHVVNGEVVGASDIIDGGAGADTLTGGAGGDTFVFHAGEANGDTVTDFSDANGDHLQFVGYGAGASFTQVDATHWTIGGETITFSNAPLITPGDYVIS